MYDKTRTCGELKLHFSPSAGGLKKKSVHDIFYILSTCFPLCSFNGAKQGNPEIRTQTDQVDFTTRPHLGQIMKSVTGRHTLPRPRVYEHVQQ